MQDLHLHTGELLLPAPGVNPTAWACVACDQYTAQPEYWQQAEALVGDQPSALRLVLPEIYLAQAAERIPQIHRTMETYLAQGVLTTGVRDGFILAERDTPTGTRVGLVALVDVEGYHYQPTPGAPIRATEGTILSRIPPRLSARRGAALELSHVQLLIDDPNQTVLEPLFAKAGRLAKLYDFPLMLGGGHLRGYAVTDPADIGAVFETLQKLWAGNPGGMLFAVGDGNHSLATARAYWDEIKPTLPPSEWATHPARFAMVEVQNIHDDALQFEPIHRVLFGFDGDALLPVLEAYAERGGMSLAGDAQGQPITVAYEGKEVTLSVTGSPDRLAVGTLDRFLEGLIREHPGLTLDYVHGQAAARALAIRAETVAFLLPALAKQALFPTVEALGALPRKTFSMGEAHEKRYYMEARRLSR